MAQVRTLDGNILSWVKNEIDTTMQQARQALEAHVETPDDESQLRFCLNYLHQVNGTLQMVELYGASMLAEELERVTQAIIDKRVSNHDDAYEGLMRGLMQLPDYLEKLQAGQPDYPIILLPLINDLRATRNAGLLTESALFSPDLEVDAPIPFERVEQPIDTLARKLRHAYHLGLLNVFRGTDAKSGLKKISAVVEKLRHASNDPDASRMLWAAGGVIEALQDQGIDSSVAVKLLLGQVDRQVKKIIDKGEFALSNEPPKDLLKNLLYYVASSNSGGLRVKELKDAFHLASVMPDNETLTRARADLSAPNAALMRTVSTVLLDDLAQVKETLDVFMRTKDRNNSGAPVIMSAKLAQMADTLGMLGFGDQRHILQDQVTSLNEMSASKREITDASLMDVASALLGIEAILHEPTGTPVDTSARPTSDESQMRVFQDPERRKLIKRVVDEAKVDLNVIKEAFHEYGRAPKQIQILNDVPGLLDRIRGSLSIMGLDRAANILKLTAHYVQNKILEPGARPEPRALELLADAISSVEYYLESLVESWGHPTAILDVAEQALVDLGITSITVAGQQSIPAPATKTTHAAEEEQTLVDIPMPSSGGAEQDITLEMSMPDIPDAAMQDGDAVDDTTQILIEGFDELQQIDGMGGDGLRSDNIAEPESEGSISQEFNLPMFDQRDTTPGKEIKATPALSQSSMTSAAAKKSTLADELDDEIVEIFLEEADEEYANISRTLPSWFNNPENEAPLKDLRRSFHTLKGSGRLVGAVDVGEFAWSLESMLNRVLDRTISHSPAMFELMEKARSTLPHLFNLFRTGDKPGPEVFTIMAQAEALSQGKSPKAAPSNKVKETAAPAAATVKKTTIPSPQGNEKTLTGEDKKPKPAPAVMDEVSIEDTEPTMTQQLLTSDELDFALEELNELLSPDGVPASAVEEDDAVEFEGIELEAIPDTPSSTQIKLATELPFDFSLEEGESTEIIPLPPPAVDPVLLDIYRKEIVTHLDSLREYVEVWHAGKDRSANPKLVRALHTIKGSSRTANVQEVADLCGELEDYARDLQDDKLLVNDEFVVVLQECELYIEQAVKLLDMPGAMMPSNSILVAKVRHLVADKPYLRQRQTTAPPELELTPDHDSALPVQPVRTKEELVESGTPDYDIELLEIFLEEGVDILNDSDHSLHAWIAEPENKDHVRALQRQLHTLKGGARMAGVSEIGDLSHSIESLLTAIVDFNLPETEQMYRALLKAQDRLVNMLEIVRNNQVPAPANQLIEIITALAAGKQIDDVILSDNQNDALSESATGDAADADEQAPIVEIDTPIIHDIEFKPTDLTINHAEFSPMVEAADEASSYSKDLSIRHDTAPMSFAVEETGDLQSQTEALPQRTRVEQVRVRADLLDNLVNFAGEVSIYRSRMELQTNAFRYNLKEFDDTVARLREQLRKFEIETETQIQYRIEETGHKNADFDPLELDRFTQMQTLSRGMLESLNDLDSLRGILMNLTRESETLLLQQSRVNTELQEGLMRTRMVPVSGQVPRLRRIVRQVTEELAKQAELHIHGADNELDRSVLERIMSPLEHMLRNAVAHGIESPDVRVARGKPEAGNIQLSFTREASDIIITVSDDGGGINIDAIRKKAIERGMIRPGANVKDEDLIDLILESGFSTAEHITQIAGRGVGMDVVNSEIKQLGGHMEIKTEQGKGALFRISMPLSLSVARSLLVTVSDETFAIPLIGLESVERVSRDDIIQMQKETNSVYKWLDNDYRYIHLSSVLGLTEMQPPTEEQRRMPLLLVRSGEYRAAIHVDGLIGSREIVVKPVGAQLSTLRGIAGATIMGDGSVVLILDTGVLIRTTSMDHEKVISDTDEEAMAEVAEKHIPLVMVVDDSITVRKVTTRFLERNNFITLSAKDGVDALTQLQEHKPDIMLLDVEMPRMDGFELATNIRNDPNLQHLPIIMITSRTGQKHRDRALGIGVNIYMGKPYSEAELLDNINKLLSI